MFNKKNAIMLVFSIGVCFLAAVIGSLFTFSSIPTWYATLNKPFFTPPGWLFGPAWTLLYILMGISLYLVIKDGFTKKSSNAVTYFWVQLMLNALWSVIFFGLKSPLFALVEIILLWTAIFMTIKKFYPISKTAAWLLIPYICWVSFAAVLNFAIFLLN